MLLKSILILSGIFSQYNHVFSFEQQESQISDESKSEASNFFINHGNELLNNLTRSLALHKDWFKKNIVNGEEVVKKIKEDIFDALKQSFKQKYKTEAEVKKVREYIEFATIGRSDQYRNAALAAYDQIVKEVGEEYAEKAKSSQSDNNKNEKGD